MKTKIIAIITFMATLVGASCCSRHDDTTPVPRRYAYPRMELPDSSFVANDTLPFNLQSNKNAEVEVERRDKASTWVNVIYPSLDASILYTFTKAKDAADLQAIIDNRLERIGLNAGSSDVEEYTFGSPSGYEHHVYVARNGTTPVQFLSTDGVDGVISGAGWLKNGGDASADSIYPLIDMLRRDIVHSLKTLQR